MSIVRVIAVDPSPRTGSKTDVLVFQVPENSREFEFLTSLLTQHFTDWVTIPSERPRKPVLNLQEVICKTKL